MKKNLTALILMLMTYIPIFGQTYQAMWKEVDDANRKDLPQTEQAVLARIVDKAEKGKAYGHLLKALLMEGRLKTAVAPDSLENVMERLQRRERQTSDEVLRAVYNTVLGSIYNINQAQLDEDGKKSEDCFDRAVSHPELLAAVNAADYEPLVVKGSNSAQFFNDDLLSIIAEETGRYGVLHDYYQQSGNRRGALFAALKMIENERSNSLEDYATSSTLQRIDSLISVYDDLPEVGEAVIARYNYMEQSTTANSQQKWDYLEMAIQRWGAYPRINQLRNSKASLSTSSFYAGFEKLAVPGRKQTIHLSELKNVNQVILNVYRMNAQGDVAMQHRLDNEEDFRKIKPLLTALPEMAQAHILAAHQPYETFEDSLTLGGLPAGVYVLEIQTLPSTSVRRCYYYVSNLRLLAIGQSGGPTRTRSTRYVVTDAQTGQPVPGARIELHYGSDRKDQTVVVTDGHGEAQVTHPQTYLRYLFISTNTDKYCMAGTLYDFYQPGVIPSKKNKVQVFTDRAIYRPGQTVHAAAILYENRDGYDNVVQARQAATMRLYDANNQMVKEIQTTTDDYGLCTADFILPAKGLTGRFRVSVNSGSQHFQVTEYKRPAFKVEIPKVADDYRDGDTITVKGTACSYAGVPVQNARVSYQVNRTRAFWWRSYARYWNMGAVGRGSEDDLMASGETTTDSQGRFSMQVPMVLPKTGNPGFYDFVVTADVVDQAGETHQGEVRLPLGSQTAKLTLDLPEKVLVEKHVKGKFNLFNAAGVNVDATVKYRIDDGKWQSVKTNAEWALGRLSSGRHTIAAICDSDTLQQTFTVFSLDDKRPVVPTKEWIFLSADQFPEDGTPVTLQVGSSDSNVHLVYSLFSGDKVLENGRVDLSNQLLNRKLTYRDEYGNGVCLAYAWIKDGVAYQHYVTIKRPVPDKRLKVQWNTFRDRLTPGQQETWTMTVTKPDGKPADAQVMAALYDKSLDQFVTNDWRFTPFQYLLPPKVSWATFRTTQGRLMGSMQTSDLSVPQLKFSRFDHDVYPIFRSRGMFASNRLMMKSVAVDEVSLGSRSVGSSEDKVFDCIEGLPNGLQVSAAAEETAADSRNDAGSQSSQSGQLRENLDETAFFYPQLTTDAQGRVVLSFTLPESLTTWRFLGIAHTTDMMAGSIEGEAVARKDVMIQPNMPRFIRTGDEATLSARIFNTSAKTVSGSVLLQLIDPETEAVVSEQRQTVSVDAESTGNVTFTLSPDGRQPLLIVRVSISGDGYSDGEQHYLPVLPDREHVTVTVPFTQNKPGTKTVDLHSLIPDGATQGQFTVEYTNNPAWLMIQALPGVGHPADDCALCQAAAYYSNAIGRHIIRQVPNAKHIFEAWSREQGQETSLMSNLMKDQSLKDLLQNETPWVTDARRESDQKQRLADFFDENVMNQRLQGAVAKLKEMQRADGSWSWWPEMPGSWYMTVEISQMLVRLNQMTAPQEETRKMLGEAFRFMGREIVETVDQMKKQAKKGVKPTFPSHKALQWLYMCAVDGRKLSADVASANKYLINLLKKETQRQTIYEKALSAVIFAGSDGTLASQYVKSLKEYTVYREDMGRYYDTPRASYSWRDYRIPTQVAAIEAIRSLTPADSLTIQEMQRWLLQEKRTQAWDTPVNSVDAIYAFMDGNAQTLAAQEKSVLKIDGQTVDTSDATAGIGYVKTSVPAQHQHTFTAEKTSAGTSWGAVYAQFLQKTSQVETLQSGITVQRELLSADRTPLTAGLQVGSRVTVRITITADRDYDFVQVVDRRAACMEPVRQLSGYRHGYYCTPKDQSTNYYFDVLTKGKHVIETEYYIDRSGIYETGTCAASCAYSPEFRGVAKSQTIQVK